MNKETLELKSYYQGRNAAANDEINPDRVKNDARYRQGVRDMQGEINLDLCDEWN